MSLSDSRLVRARYFCRRDPIFALAARHAIPAIYERREYDVAVKLDQPAAIDGPQQTTTARTVERTVAAAAEQGQGVPT